MAGLSQASSKFLRHRTVDKATVNAPVVFAAVERMKNEGILNHNNGCTQPFCPEGGREVGGLTPQRIAKLLR
jgi:hypothetical protein